MPRINEHLMLKLMSRLRNLTKHEWEGAEKTLPSDRQACFWDQNVWGEQHECGTFACAAGWTIIENALDEGHTFEVAKEIMSRADYSCDARHLLKMSQENANRFFHHSNTMDKLTEYSELLLDGKDIPITANSY